MCDSCANKLVKALVVETMSSRDDLDIEIDLASVKRAAARVCDMLTGLRLRYDLARFEYTRRVRIAPTEIPHSHPVLTLNTFVRDEVALVSTYLHEQMHWYLTWYSKSRASEWETLLARLRARYRKCRRQTRAARRTNSRRISTSWSIGAKWRLRVSSSAARLWSGISAACRSTAGSIAPFSTTGMNSAHSIETSVSRRFATRPTYPPRILRWLVSKGHQGINRLPASTSPVAVSALHPPCDRVRTHDHGRTPRLRLTLMPACASRAVIAARKPTASSAEWTLKVISRDANW